MSTEAKCPLSDGARRRSAAQQNADWWRDQLNLKVLHQHSSLSDPMGATTVEVKSSHVPMRSQSRTVLDVIRAAAKAIQNA